jgi:hypothetical protein
MLTDALIDGLARAAELGAAFDRVEDRIIDQRGRQARPALSAARRDAAPPGAPDQRPVVDGGAPPKRLRRRSTNSGQ